MLNRSFLQGCARGLPIVTVFFLYGIPFGVLAAQVGIPAWAAIAMSIFVLGGSAQFAAVQLLAVGAGAFDIILATFFLHLRHLMMSASFALRMPPVRGLTRYLLAHGLIDESYAIILGHTPRDQQVNVSSSLGTMFVAWGSWVVATAIGVGIGEQLHDLDAFAGVIAIMFAILLGLAVQVRRDALVAALSAIVTYLLMQWLPGDSQFLLGAIIACTVAVCCFAANDEGAA